MKRSLHLALGVLALATASAQQPENLLRNGSFEGGTLYWHNVNPAEHQLVREKAAVGEYAMRIEKGYIMSAPFVAKRGESFTVSLFVKGEQPGTVQVSMPPSAREPGQKAKRLWVREAGQSAKVTTDWQRVSFTWPADVPQDGFWPNPHYLIQIGGEKGKVIHVDGVTVTQGKEGTPAYVPRRPMEIVAECPDLPGYEGAKANLFDKGASPHVIAHVSNPGSQPRNVTVRWQLFDYEGERPIGAATDKQLTVPAGKTISETVPMMLVETGCVLARVSVIEGQETIDKSDLPLTSLPYPKNAIKPDWRERFGGSFAGGQGMLQKLQRLGFGWTRWYPGTKWHNFQPDGPEDWKWFDEEFNLAHQHGVSQHVVLYGWPKWIMDEHGHPLPRDMRWGPEDPKWDDLTIETAWDRYVKGAARHFKGRSVVFEISNEPELDGWDKYKTEYAKFNIRTAKLIRAVDPKAKIMVDNVYGIPSGLNAEFFKEGGLKYIDMMSWHDYHAGWLTDGNGIKKMRQAMDEAGGKHVEIWFNEGWAFTNTVVDEPIACTGLTSAESTNAQMASVAEMTINGQEKTILFHTGYEKHGMSFWDYSGPGTMLWDWYGNPLPLVAAWNVMTHHIGISDEVGWVRPPGANFAIFDDQRNGRGVCVVYADRESKDDAVVDLSAVIAAVAKNGKGSLIVEDIMGNAAPLKGTQLTVSKTTRPLFLYASNKAPGKVYLDALTPLDRKNASFMTQAAPGAAPTWSLPPVWEGTKKGESNGSVAMADGKPIWKLEQVWPPDWKKPEYYRPMVWTGTDWNVKEGGFGGQPGANLKDTTLTLGTRAPHGKPMQLRTAAVVFVAPKAGTYSLAGEVATRIWDGKNKTHLHVVKKNAQEVTPVAKLTIDHGGKVPLEDISVDLAAGDELALIPVIDGAFSGGDTKFKDLKIVQGGSARAEGGDTYQLPLSWEGTRKGSADNNPLVAGGNPIWRLDQVWPDQPIFVNNYLPLRWNGTAWFPAENHWAGQPEVKVNNGAIDFAVRGTWTGREGQRIASLAFIAPKSATYRVTAKASSKPWEGNAKTYKLGLFKKDTQRAVQQDVIELPRSGETVPLDFTIDLTAGHELVFLPLMPDWHNATHTKLEELVVREVK